MNYYHISGSGWVIENATVSGVLIPSGHFVIYPCN